ncbi:12401_t:CDS:2, partial [Racocetra persica]
ENGIKTDQDNIHIHIPILTLYYGCDLTSEFIQDIRDVINISDETEKKKNLKEKLNYYGEYVITSATIGGVITIKNWSKFDDISKSRLKAYLQWSIDYAKGIKVNNFEKTSIDDLYLFTNSKRMKTAEDLYKWVKDLPNSNDFEIISYESFKPAIQLLPQDLFEYSNFQRTDESELISKIRSRYDKINILEWLIPPAFPLYTYDWIQDNFLQHGIILQRSKPGRAKKAAFKFLKEPKITPINKITIILSKHKSRQEDYLLENGIILKKEDGIELDKIPYPEHSSTLNIPLEDFKDSKKQPSNAIYCQIIFHTIKISFDPLDIEYLREFSNAIDSALQDQNESSKSETLCKLFGEDYGHLLPRTFTLGGVLSKTYKSNTHPPEIKTQQLDLKSNDPYDWLNTLADNPKNWNIISYEDWIQIYKTSPSDDILCNDSDSSSNNGILHDKSSFDTEECGIPIPTIINMLTEKYNRYIHSKDVYNILTCHTRDRIKGLSQRFPEIILMDSTYKTNHFGIPLLLISGVDATGITFLIASRLISDETISSFCWVLQQLKQTADNITINKIQTVLTDKDLAILSSIRNELPHVKHQLCIWHLEQNLVKNLTGKLGNRFLAFSKDFKITMIQNTEETFEVSWNHLLIEYPEVEKASNAHLKRLLGHTVPLPELISALDKLSCQQLQHSQYQQYRIRGSTRQQCPELLKSISAIISNFTYSLILEQYNLANIKNYSIEKQDSLFKVYYNSNYKHIVYQTDIALVCSCNYTTQFSLPCRHIIALHLFSQKEISINYIGKHWIVNTYNRTQQITSDIDFTATVDFANSAPTVDLDINSIP